MMEAGVLIGGDGKPAFWHLPEGRTGGSLPDSRRLWDVIWESRGSVRGFAHSHPGSGVPGPSWEDVTTFAAVEGALGRRLTWWITSSDKMVACRWQGPGKHDYVGGEILRQDEPSWAAELRRVSESL